MGQGIYVYTYICIYEKLCGCGGVRDEGYSTLFPRSPTLLTLRESIYERDIARAKSTSYKSHTERLDAMNAVRIFTAD